MELFRKEALESISSTSGMNHGVRAVRIRAVVFVVLLALCTAIFSCWLFFGTIYDTLSVGGIIWPAQNNGTVYAVYGGTISKTVVSRGSAVKAGDILAVIPQEDILAELTEKRQTGISDAALQQLYDEYDRRSIIRSSIDGIVTYIVDENSYVFGGDRIAAIVPYSEAGNNKTLTAFIPADKSGLLSLGMEAQVMPDFAPREEYGYINAYVSNISAYPVTGRSIEAADNTLFITGLNPEESYLQIEITLVPDMSAQSGLKWSNPKSGNIDAAMGTICTADIVIEKCRPYAWLF